MAILKVLKYPHPILREQCTPIESFDQALETLVNDMVETMYSGPGAIGLAAPQIGQAVRVVVLDINAKTSRDGLKILINPEITQQSRNKLVREGCLSFPEYLANIKRALRCTVQAYDVQGNRVEYQADGIEAIAIQHELDHLNGILLVDRVNSLKTDLIRRKSYVEATNEDSEKAE